MIQTTEIRPPYPRLGELYRALAGALDTKARDRGVDRLAREGDYDWSLVHKRRETLVTKPLRGASDPDFAQLVGQFVDHMHANYVGLVAYVPLDSLNRGDALPLLVEHYFAPYGASLLVRIKQNFGGPELMTLLDPENHPLAVVLDCFDRDGGRNLAKAAFPGSTGTDRSDRELIARWASGAQLPDLPSIKRFADAVAKSGDANMREQAPGLRRWLLVGRALAWLEKESPQPFRAVMCRYLSLGLPAIDIGEVLSLANIEVGKRFSVLKNPGSMLYEDLMRTTPKAPGDQARVRDSLDAFQRLCEEHDPEKRTRFHVAWLRGRWHVLSGQFDAALSCYEEAASLANYRAGNQQKQIVEETLVLAAFVGHKPLLKNLKHRAIVFGLFTNPQGGDVIEEREATSSRPPAESGSDPRGGDVIEDWEIDHLRQQFPRIFPHQGRFPEALNLEDDHEYLPFLVFHKDGLEQLKPDLRKPNRVRTVHAQDGQKRRRPQLQLFASIGRFDAVRALLERGASVDQLDEAGGSALLCAIQHAEDRGDRRALDLLLERPHTKATLDSATTRKRLTPLICAVSYGEPDVVERLLAMGATADRSGHVDEVTPLYWCMTCVAAIRRPEQYHQLLLAAPDPERREVLRRYNVSLGGVFGDEQTLPVLLENPENRAIFEQVAAMVKELSGLDESKLLRIVELLLGAGANPNTLHKYPAGRTPLMLAAEIDSAEAFELMMQRGGNPHERDAQGLDSIKIAYGFGSRNVVEYMRRKGIL